MHWDENLIANGGANANGNVQQIAVLTGQTNVLRQGICKWFNPTKGYGFIRPHDGGTDVFVHQKAIQMNGFRVLTADQEVEFVCERSQLGMSATLVLRKDMPSGPARLNACDQAPTITGDTGVLRRGKCKWFNASKGYGFVTPDDGCTDVFVHQSSIKMKGFRLLLVNQEVEFICERAELGMIASFVRPLPPNGGAAPRPAPPPPPPLYAAVSDHCTRERNNDSGIGL